MDVLNEIIRNSAIGPLSKGYQSFVLFLFSAIVVTLGTMLFVLLTYGRYVNVQFGY
ncbi:hypothetical protein [Maribacter sp. 2210JD10-5]|uniref:hypothetical protein n=1 Tax=Maribacter sp. 2210JD10-5 TaxID=3386272 RepID=UPI0039BD073C